MGDILLGRHSEIIHTVDGGKCRDKCHALHIDDGLHADLSPAGYTSLLQGARNSVVEGPEQDRAIEDFPLLSQTKYRDLFLNIDQAEQTAQRLAQHSRQRASRDAPFHHDYEEKIEHNIKDRADDQKIQRHFTVAQGPQCIGKEIIDKGKDQTHKDDPQVHYRRMDNVFRHLQKPQQRI